MCVFKMLAYNITVQTYQTIQSVILDKYLNGVAVKNVGTTLLVVNTETLQPGESKSIGGNYGEIYRGRLDMKFQTQAIPPPTIVNLVEVTQKFYTGVLVEFKPIA